LLGNPMPDLFGSALNVAPFYGGTLDTREPEKQLLEAFRLAKEHLFKVLPAGTRLDESKAILAADIVAQQIQAQKDAMASSLNARQDLSPDSAISLDNAQMRQYHIGRYLVASGGLGVYTSGVGKDLIEQESYLEGIEGRIRIFSEIIHAGETGQLVQLVNAESVAPEGGRIIIASEYSKVSSERGAGLGVVGFGKIPVPQIIIAVAIIAFIISAAVVLDRYFARDTEASYAQSQAICRDAIEKGYKDVVKQCVELSAEATQGGVVGDLLGSKATKDITNYLILFGAVYLGVLLLPTITHSVTTAQEKALRE
jgi:hypothetical protein